MTSPSVIDASITLAWCFRDEAAPYAAVVRSLLRRSPAMAPGVWPLEIANALIVGERRRRLSEHQIVWFLAVLESLVIEIDDHAGMTLLGPPLALARQQSLSACDASYLELADQRGLPFATQDRRLRVAAERIGVEVVRGIP